jgi:Serine/threonine protein phosphatase
MATTLTAMVVTEDGLAIGHIGDSRAYAWRGRTLTQLTRDDTYVQGLVDNGVISPDGGPPPPTALPGHPGHQRIGDRSDVRRGDAPAR